jgi:hypothetical protein
LTASENLFRDFFAQIQQGLGGRFAACDQVGDEPYYIISMASVKNWSCEQITLNTRL